MDAEALVLAILDALPKKEIQGKKRLQKMSYFALQKGAEADVRFFLHDFGPFSADVASATDLLSILGDISEREIQLGRLYATAYQLADSSSVLERLPKEAIDALNILDSFSTIELEIASTIFYFMSSENMKEDAAISATTKLKPSKSQPAVIRRAKEALSKVELYERGRTN